MKLSDFLSTHLLLLLLAATCCVTDAIAQETIAQFGLKSGVNLSIFSASINSESSFKTGFHFGGYFRSAMSDNLFLRMELYYSSQGQKDEYYNAPSGPSIGSTTTTVNYINLPLLLEVGRKVNFQVGPQFGFLLSAHEKGTFRNDPVDDDLKDYMKSLDIALALGVGFNPGEHINCGVRFNMGLGTIFDEVPDDFPAVKNQVFHFFIGYTF